MQRLLVLIVFPLGFSASCSAPAPTPALGEIADGQVRIVDLSYPLNEQNPHWPGEAYKPFRFETLATLEADGVFSGAFCMPEHLGTHVDAPNHFEAARQSVDELELSQLVAPMVVIDVSQNSASNADYQVSEDDLRTWEEVHNLIPQGAVVFAYTGWGQYWNDFDRYKNQDETGRLHFPGFSPQAARFLVEERSTKGIGIDTLSVDYGLSSDFAVHHIVNGAGGYHIENAAALDQVPARGAWVIIAPIKIEGGSGGPARVWALFPYN